MKSRESGPIQVSDTKPSTANGTQTRFKLKGNDLVSAFEVPQLVGNIPNEHLD